MLLAQVILIVTPQHWFRMFKKVPDIRKCYSDLFLLSPLFDFFPKTIEMADFDGSNQAVLIRGDRNLPHPYGLTVWDNSIFWTDWSDKTIMRAKKDNGGQITEKAADLDGLMAIHAINMSRRGRDNFWTWSLNCVVCMGRWFVSVSAVEINKRSSCFTNI